jgi:formylglycine-generating enzyme required for sulfatase activity
MKKHARAFALCLLLSPLCCALVFPQVGADKRPPPPPKTSTPKTQPKRTTTRTPSPTSRSRPRQTAPQIEMVLIPVGTFMMGSPDSEAGRVIAEGPQHQVSVQSFYLGKYEVTQAQYKAVMGTNPSNFKGNNLPVENVSWDDATEFCRRLSQMTGKEYRLPSEAEWEYACRAGTTTPFAFGSSLSSDQANFDGNYPYDSSYPYGGAAKGVYRDKTTPVGSFAPNNFGLYDMHGNVWEWCQDYWHENYNEAPTDGSAWLSGGEQQYRVIRGGSWGRYGVVLRSAYRDGGIPTDGSNYTGFRVVAVSRAS